MSCSSCPGKKRKQPTAQHQAYFLGEAGFVEIRYNGWETPYEVYGDEQLYTFDSTSRNKLVDVRDVDYLLEIVVDGVKVFDQNESERS